MLRAVVAGGLRNDKKVHFILDEAASLGHMDALDDAVDKYRGYGVRLQLYYQILRPAQEVLAGRAGSNAALQRVAGLLRRERQRDGEVRQRAARRGNHHRGRQRGGEQRIRPIVPSRRVFNNSFQE